MFSHQILGGKNMATKIGVCFALILLVSSVSAGLSFAQVDPEKVLVGTWEGQVEALLSSGNQFVLIINSVKKISDTEWVARARFGRPDMVNKETQGGREIEVIQKDNDIVVNFTGKSGTPMRLKLVGDNRLEGTLNTTERGQRNPSDHRIKFEKVASQPK